MNIKKTIFFLANICVCLAVTAQDAATIERKLIELNKNTKALFHNKSISQDSIAKTSIKFKEAISTYANNFPQMLEYSFPDLTAEGDIKIKTSKNKKFRIYSWDTWLGTSGMYFDGIYQYTSGQKSGAKAYNKNKLFYEVYQVNRGKDTIYLGAYYIRTTPEKASQGIKAFKINKNGSLNDSLKIFKTPAGLKNEMVIDFDIATLDDANGEQIIKYDEGLKTVYIPVVMAKGVISSTFKAYKLMNGNFVLISK